MEKHKDLIEAMYRTFDVEAVGMGKNF